MDTDSHGFNLGPPRIDTDAHGSLFAGGTNLDHTPQSAIGTLQCKSSICNRQSPMNVGHGWTRIHTASIWGPPRMDTDSHGGSSNAADDVGEVRVRIAHDQTFAGDLQ